jgi:hypothetical protein
MVWQNRVHSYQTEERFERDAGVQGGRSLMMGRADTQLPRRRRISPSTRRRTEVTRRRPIPNRGKMMSTED